MTTKILATLALLALVAVAPAAAATFTFTTPYVAGTNPYAGIHTPVSGVNGLYYTDGLQARVDGGQLFWAFCVDLNHEIAIPPYSYHATPGDLDDWSLWPTAGAGRKAAYVYNTFVSYVASHPLANTHQLRGAVQLAIWEVLYDTDRNLRTGAFNVYSDPYSLVNTGQALLDAMPAGADGTASWMRLNNLQTGAQVQAFAGPAVPEASSLMLLGTGLVCAAAAVRRRFASHRAEQDDASAALRGSERAPSQV